MGGIAGAQEFFENPATLLFWVDFWVGLGIVSALVGNVWDFVSPLSAAARALERRLAARGTAVVPYPRRLGVWPAVALLLAVSWAELVWDGAREPRMLALLLLCYGGFQLAATAVFGADTWLARGEVFTVVARTLARFAPLELYVDAAPGPCRAGRCVEPERIGCPACWLDAPPDQRGIRLRPYGAGLRREPALGAGGGVFVLALLATVVYDGFSQTERYAELEAFVLRRWEWLGSHEQVLGTLVMAAVVSAFALAFAAVAALVSGLERGGAAEAARRYAPTLVPIAAAYFVSHYFLYLVYAGQLTGGAVLDPLGKDWIGDYAPWAGVPGGVVWYIQVALIVWGHVAAVFAAHRASLAVHSSPRSALVAQAPLVLLMVAYTFSGLWVLGQVLRAV